MKKTEIIRALTTNLCLLLIIFLVYAAAFGPLGQAVALQGPALKGRTGADNIALQIAVDQHSDLQAYMDALEKLGVRGTFFFCTQYQTDDRMIQEVKQRGHGVGYYSCAANDGTEAGMYIGGGYSVPVMSYEDNGDVREVCPSINLTKLKKLDNWPEVLDNSISGDMFIYLMADNDQDDFKKVVQIVLDKGYTILKVDEML